MGEIFRATYAGMAGFERPCAIKRILPHLSDDEEFIDRLISEAKIAVQLTHGNIVQVYELGRVENDYFIAMEWVDGADLSTLLVKARAKDQRMPLPLAIHVMREVARAVDFAHRKNDADGKPLGIVHRDISPQNVMVSLDGAVKLGDFGIARAGGIARRFATGMGAVLGKRRYMSPEQRRGEVVDPRTDVFALGALLQECITGVAPDPEMPRKPLDTAKYPADLEALVATALAFDPKSRLATAGELVEGLDRMFVRLASQEGAIRDASLELGKFCRLICPPGEKPVAKRSLTDRMKAAMPRLAAPEPREVRDLERDPTVDATGVFVGDVAAVPVDSVDFVLRPTVPKGPPSDGEVTVGTGGPVPRGSGDGEPASTGAGEADEHAVTLVLSKAFAEVAPGARGLVLPQDPQGPDAATVGVARGSAPTVLPMPGPTATATAPVSAPLARGSGTGASSASTTTGPGAAASPAQVAVPSGHVERGAGREPSRAPPVSSEGGSGTGRRARLPAAVPVTGPIDFPAIPLRRAAKIPWGPIAIVVLAAGLTAGVLALRGIGTDRVGAPATPTSNARPTAMALASSAPTDRATPRPTATVAAAIPVATAMTAPTPAQTQKQTPTPRVRPTRVASVPTAPPTPTPGATAGRPAAMATLNIGADPWAFVYLDGKKLEGTTPLYEVRVKAGPHVVIAENPKFGRREQTVTLKADEVKQVIFDFRTPAE